MFIGISGYSNFSLMGVSYRNIVRMHLSVILKKYFYLEDCYYLQEGCFCVHVSEEITYDEAKNKFDGLNNELIQPVHISDVYIPIKINGIYIAYPYNKNGSEGLIARGVSALSSLEKNNITTLMKFSEDIYNKHFRLSQLDSYIIKGINKNEFHMVYQPQYNKTGDDIIGYEALIRWQSDVFGFVSPSEFIPIAEKNGTIYKIGQFVIKEVCGFISKFYNLFGYLPKVSINVSFVELINPNFAVDLKNVIQAAKIPNQYIIIEITETAISEFLDIVLGNIRIIRALGFEIHLDDFGTGYSSLNHLSKLSIDCVKIDKSFIDDIHMSNTAKNLVQSIIELSHRLGMRVIAEGIESKEQFEVLQYLQCDAYQGYYFNKPLSVETILTIEP